MIVIESRGMGGDRLPADTKENNRLDILFWVAREKATFFFFIDFLSGNR
jgi:hypothetical protein